MFESLSLKYKCLKGWEGRLPPLFLILLTRGFKRGINLGLRAAYHDHAVAR
jgi:hypothetical protein